MKANWFGATAVAALAVYFVPAASAVAQSTTSADQLPEVIVQARRVDESQQKVPIAVSTLSAKVLQQDTVTQVSDIQSLAPTLTIDPGSLGGSADPRFSLRGLSGTLVSDPSVVTYFDQVPTDPRNFAYTLYDLSSVQVLKGPEGTLFGKNSTGGAVLFEPTRPGPNFGGYIDGRYGNFNDREVTGVVNLPINGALSARIAANGEWRDGTVESVTGGFKYNTRDHDSIRGELLFKPNDQYENYLEGTLYQVREIGNQPILTATSLPALGPLLAYQQSLGKDKSVNSFPAPFDVDYGSLTDIATAHFGAVTLKNIAHIDYAKYHVAYDLTGTGEEILDQDDFQNNHNYSDELQLLGKAFDNKLSWLLGAYYDKFVQEESETFDLGTQPGNPYSPQVVNLSQPQTSTAVFGQATYDFSQWIKGVSVTAGYRYTWDDKSFTQSRTQPGGFIPTGLAPPFPPFVMIGTCALAGFPGVNPATCTEQLSAKYSNSNYDVSLNWQATDQVLLYVAARKGYKAGGFNFGDTNSPAYIEYKPETVSDIELGLKSDFKLGEMPVRANASVYQGKYDDIQAQFIDYSGTLPEELVVNADPVTGEHNKATLTGGELELTVIPMHGLDATAFYGYAQGKYDQFIDESTGTPVSLAGQQIDGIARNTLGLTVNYSPTLPDNWGRPTASAVIYSRSALSENQLNPSNLPGFTTLDLRLDWRHFAGQPIDVALYGKNVTDKRYPVSNSNLGGIGVTSTQYNEPAMYGIELRYWFGR
jgi:iron complex outermembrane receptor protein